MIKKIVVAIVIGLLAIALMAGVTKGHKGNPIYNQTENSKLLGGPFETTNSSSRYALVEAMAENKTFFFTDKQAAFSASDIASHNGKIFSVFTPGVSFVALPFYLLGKQVGMPQLFTYFSTAIVAILNLFLVFKLARKLGAGFYESLMGGGLFLFGTNALAYALTLTQHHLSTMFILLALLNSFSKRTWINNLGFGLLYGAGLLMDIPNGLMMLPLVGYILFKHWFWSEGAGQLLFSVKLRFLALALGLMPLLGVFAWYNYQLTGSPTTISQSLGRVDFTVDQGIIQRNKESNRADEYEQRSFYNTRSQSRGLYILLVSNERGWLYYSPMVVVGILGLIIGFRNKETRTLVALAAAVGLFCLISYTSFGDPWGGWSFGPRYLIPASAIVSAGVSVALSRFKKNVPFVVTFFALAIYGVAVNSLGAMTTSAIPPKVEAVNLPDPIPYTYEYNLGLLEQDKSSALVYNLYLYESVSFRDYWLAYISAASVIVAGLYVVSLFSKERNDYAG
ncbi:MAG: hypothetical protein HYS86_01805 [Candidatus Chisholmbacteria bacterium]|nr:hypothetical protein [Candidatus Chisholmbacteria bacterium]